LIGIALDEKLIKDLDSPLGELLPRRRAQMTGDMARVTLRQLMTMSAGFQDDDTTPSPFGDAIRQDGDAVTFILKLGLVSPPDETFAYSNSSAHLVSAVLTQALRQADGSNPRTVLDYATEKLFKPLGIDTRNAYTARFRPDDPTPFENAGFGWATDAQGINIGAGNLRLRPADMLKFGQLYLDHGKWHGKQLVPEQWVVAASVAPSPASSQYGLMWWLDTTTSGDSAYTAAGFGGQLIVVVPKHRLVVAVASQPTKDYTTNSQDVFALVSDVILTTFH
jgi:CubicO group peptidase (beta-lactamase class C family)